MSQSPSQQSKRKRAPAVDAANIIEGESRRAKRRKDGSPVKVSESASSAAGDASVDVEGEGEGDAEGEVKVKGEERAENVSDETRKVATDLGIKLLETLRKTTNSRSVVSFPLRFYAAADGPYAFAWVIVVCISQTTLYDCPTSDSIQIIMCRSNSQLPSMTSGSVPLSSTHTSPTHTHISYPNRPNSMHTDTRHSTTSKPTWTYASRTQNATT